MLSYRETYVDFCKPFPETISRSRRLTLFQEASGLVDFLNDDARYILNLIPKENRDHISFWTDGETEFVLTEPYGPRFTSSKAVCCIKIPMNLAPYCGRYSTDANEEPWTTSWLYTSNENSKKLGSIYGRLKEMSRTAPWWSKL